MTLFARSRQPEVRRPAKRTHKNARVTCAELEGAIAAFTAGLARDGLAPQILEKLAVLTYRDSDDEAVRLEKPVPISVDELDAALAENPDAPARAVKVLKRFRALLANAEDEAAGAAAVPVTRAEFDAFRTVVAIALANAQAALRDNSVRLDSNLERVGEHPAQFGL